MHRLGPQLLGEARLGVVGARAYHVITDYHRFQGRRLDVFKVWEGGDGILGGST